MLNKFDFCFGERDLSLVVPPFFVDLEKRRFKSILTHKTVTRQGLLVYIYVTQSFQPQKLLILKSVHPDFYVPDGILRLSLEKYVSRQEIDSFKSSVISLEKTWPYEGNGVWGRNLDSVNLHMILLVEEDRWTIRPAISKSSVEGFGVEIPVKAESAESFLSELNTKELEEIHDHTITLHFHLTVENLERFIALAKKWDYYFSKSAIWPPMFDMKFLGY